jgi:hypothetical protein
MGDRTPRVLDRLIDWLTVEVPEADGTDRGQDAGSTAAAGATGAEKPRGQVPEARRAGGEDLGSPRAVGAGLRGDEEDRRRGVLQRLIDWLTVEVPELGEAAEPPPGAAYAMGREEPRPAETPGTAPCAMYAVGHEEPEPGETPGTGPRATYATSYGEPNPKAAFGPQVDADAGSRVMASSFADEPSPRPAPPPDVAAIAAAADSISAMPDVPPPTTMGRVRPRRLPRRIIDWFTVEVPEPQAEPDVLRAQGARRADEPGSSTLAAPASPPAPAEGGSADALPTPPAGGWGEIAAAAEPLPASDGAFVAAPTSASPAASDTSTPTSSARSPDALPAGLGLAATATLWVGRQAQAAAAAIRALPWIERQRAALVHAAGGSPLVQSIYRVRRAHAALIAPLRWRRGDWADLAARGRVRTSAALAAFRRWPGAAAALLLLALALLAVAVGASFAGRAAAARLPHDGPPVPSAAAVAVGQAGAVAAAAERAAADARAAATTVSDMLASAKADAERIASLSAPALARLPSATDPSADLTRLLQAQTQAQQAVAAIRSGIAPAVDAERTAVTIAAKESRAKSAAVQASTAATAVQAALQTADATSAKLAALVPPAQNQVASWRAVHDAPAGSLGATFQDPPATWGIKGCEVVSVAAGSAAAQLGIVGASPPSHPVGDVITLIRDATDANANWPTGDCAALQAAMAQTRAGDRLTVSYEHRATVFLVIGTWVSHSGTVVVGSGSVAQRVCPGPITGRLDANADVPLTLGLSGPAGSRGGLTATLDPAASTTHFPDALLRALGYRPYRSEAGSGVVPGSYATVNLYHIPGSALAVADGGQPVPLADGVLSVVGIPGGSGSVLGGDVLAQGAHLATSGGSWTLTPPCN